MMAYHITLALTLTHYMWYTVLYNVREFILFTECIWVSIAVFCLCVCVCLSLVFTGAFV